MGLRCSISRLFELKNSGGIISSAWTGCMMWVPCVLHGRFSFDDVARVWKILDGSDGMRRDRDRPGGFSRRCFFQLIIEYNASIGGGTYLSKS